MVRRFSRGFRGVQGENRKKTCRFSRIFNTEAREIHRKDLCHVLLVRLLTRKANFRPLKFGWTRKPACSMSSIRTDTRGALRLCWAKTGSPLYANHEQTVKEAAPVWDGFLSSFFRFPFIRRAHTRAGRRAGSPGPGTGPPGWKSAGLSHGCF